MAVQSLHVGSENYPSNWVQGVNIPSDSMNPVGQWNTMSTDPIESAKRINVLIQNFNPDQIVQDSKKAFTNRKVHLILVGIGLSLAAPAFVSLVASQVPSLALLINQVATPYLLLGWAASASLIGLGILQAIRVSMYTFISTGHRQEKTKANYISGEVSSFYKSLEGDSPYRGQCTVMNYLEVEGKTNKGSKCRHFIPAFRVYSFEGGDRPDGDFTKFNPITIQSESIEGTAHLLNGCKIPLNQEACEKAAAEWEALSDEIDSLLPNRMELGGLQEVIRASVTRESGDFEEFIRGDYKYERYCFHKHSYEIAYSQHSTFVQTSNNFTASALRDHLKKSYFQLRDLKSSQEMQDLVQVEG